MLLKAVDRAEQLDATEEAVAPVSLADRSATCKARDTGAVQQKINVTFVSIRVGLCDRSAAFAYDYERRCIRRHDSLQLCTLWMGTITQIGTCNRIAIMTKAKIQCGYQILGIGDLFSSMNSSMFHLDQSIDGAHSVIPRKTP